jgi:iron complex transport system substrate-binding protein
MRYLPGLLPLLWLLCASGVAAPQRIASLNLCTDLLLLELVSRERIVSLTYWAADPDLSWRADRVGDIPLNHSLAEEIVPTQPDLVLAGQFSDVQVVSLLRRLGYRVEVMEVPLTLAGMREHLLEFGELVGEQQGAAALADAIDRRLAAVAARKPGTEPLAAVYGPQGVSPGRDTLMNDLLQLAGYRNLAAELGIVSYGSLSLEALVMSQPDVLVLDDLTQNRDSVAHLALGHPALARQFKPRQVISLPPNLTACVGPTVAEAAERLLLSRPGP